MKVMGQALKWAGKSRAAILAITAAMCVITAPGGAFAANGAAQTAQMSSYQTKGTYTASTLEQMTSIVYGVMTNSYGSTVTVRYSGDTSQLSRQLETVFKQVGQQNDYMRFVLKSLSWSWTSSPAEAVIVFKMDYWETPEQSDWVRKTAVETAASLLKPGMSAEQTVKAIHDWVIGRFSYDNSLTRHSAYDGLAKDGRTVCQGYALMTYRLLEAAGFESRIIYGDSKGSKHVWNMVKLGNRWQHIDTTLDDVDDVRLRTNYLLVSDEFIAKDHSWDRDDYPGADAGRIR